MFNQTTSTVTIFRANSIFSVIIAKLLFFCLTMVTFWSGTVFGVSLINPGPMVEQIQRISGQNIGGVNKILQDKSGFIWLATNSGLLRFDGFSIKRFEHNKINPRSLSHNRVTGMVEDEQGFIWFITWGGGLGRFTTQTEHFEHFSHKEADADTLDSDRLYSMSLASDGKLWIGSNRGINLFDRNSFKNQRLNSQLKPANADERDNIQTLFEDNQQRLWFYVKGKGLFVFDISSKQLTSFHTRADDEHSIDSNLINAIIQTHNGDIWVGTYQGVNRFNPLEQNFDRFAIPVKANNPSQQVTVKSLYQDRDQRLWIGSFYNGVSVLLPKADTIIAMNQGANISDSMTAINIKDIMQDASGAIWFATASKGLVKLKDSAMLFEHQLSTANAEVRITAIYADSKGDVWLTAKSNLYRYNQALQHFTVAFKDIGVVTAMIEGKNHQLVVSIGGQGIFNYHRDSQLLSPFGSTPQQSPKLPSNNLHSLAIDAQGTLWAGLFRSDDIATGLFSLDQSSNTYVQHLDKFTVETILPLTNHVIIGTRRNGLRILDKASGQWSVISDQQNDTSRIWQLYQDKRGRIWAATNGSGLAQLDFSSRTLSFVTVSQGLPSNSVRAITEDHQGLLWLGTTKGVVSYAPESKSLKVFDRQDGLRVDSVYPKMGVASASGDIIMANTTALSRFSPTRLLANKANKPADLPLMLSDFKLFNRAVAIGTENSPLIKTINHTNTLNLSYQNYWFSLAFASSDYNHGERVRYAYQMEGLTDRWVETDNQNRVATFISVPAGKYTFKVTTSDEEGNFNPSYRAVNIVITPPWWQTWQAKLIYAVILYVCIYGIYRHRTRLLVNRANELEQSVKERTATINQLMSRKEQMFANISHEFKTPLTLILTPLESVLSTKPALEIGNKVSMAIRNGQRLLRMVEQLLELSRLDTFTEQKSHYYSLQQTLTMLLTSFEPLADIKKLSLQCKPFNDVVVPSTADALEMILINLISNAIKYTPTDGTVTIEVVPDETTVCITVIDTGIGISEEDQQLVFNRFTRADIVHDENIPGAGIGLALVKELVESLDGTIELHSATNQGSRFKVTLPTSAEQNITPAAANGLSSTSRHEIDGLSEVVPAPMNTAIERNGDETKPTILLIDDNADMLVLLNDTLAADYVCLSASNGEAGLQLAIEQIPDLVICDVMMPGISGYEVANRLKQEQLTVHIPIVLLTAKGDIDSRMEGWKQDIDDYLAKPFHPAELRLRIDSLLSIRKLLKKRFIRQTAEQSDSGDASSQSEDEAVVSVISDKDKQFIEQFNAVLDENYADPLFCREQAASHMHVGDHQLYRKLSALLEDTFTDILREHRLKVSVELFTTGLQIGQIADKVGFTSTPYFSKCFKARYGKTPKQYQKTLLG